MKLRLLLMAILLLPLLMSCGNRPALDAVNGPDDRPASVEAAPPVTWEITDLQAVPDEDDWTVVCTLTNRTDHVVTYNNLGVLFSQRRYAGLSSSGGSPERFGYARRGRKNWAVAEGPKIELAPGQAVSATYSLVAVSDYERFELPAFVDDPTAKQRIVVPSIVIEPRID